MSVPIFFIGIECDKKASWHFIFGIKDKLSPEGEPKILLMGFVIVFPVSKVREGSFSLLYDFLNLMLS